VPVEELVILRDTRRRNIAVHLADLHGIARERVVTGDVGLRESSAPPAVQARLSRDERVVVRLDPDRAPAPETGSTSQGYGIRILD
jgi:hypothetical protein